MYQLSGTDAERLTYVTTTLPVLSTWEVTSGTGQGNKFTWGGSAWVQTHADGAAHVATRDEAAVLTESDIRTAYVATSVAVVPNTDLSVAPTSAELIAWTFSAGKKYLTAMCGRDGLSTNNTLGWWVTINAGSAVAARDRLREALDTAAGVEISMYIAATTVHANENKASFIVPNGVPFAFRSDDDITDVYVMPVAAVTPCTGSSILTVMVS